jgi:hypothetical protein
LLEECVVLGRVRGDARNVAYALVNLSTLAVAQGDLARAQIMLDESLSLHRDLGYRTGAVEGVEDVARIAAALDQPGRAAQLLGAATAFRTASGEARPPYLRAPIDRVVAGVRAALGKEAFDAAWAEGAALSIEQAIAAALTRV